LGVLGGGMLALLPGPDDAQPVANVDHKHLPNKEFVGKDGGAPKAKDKGPAKKDKGKGIETPKGSAGLLPRRALLISIDNYLYLNSVHYGSSRSQNYAGSSIAALTATFPNPPLRIPAT